MKSLRKLIYAPVLTALTMPLMSLPARAETISTASLSTLGTAAYGATAAGRDLPTILGAIIKTALGLLGLVLLVIIIYAGWLYMSAGGNAEQTKKAKEWILNAVIGLVIIMAAYAITTYIFSELLTATFGS